MKSLIIYGSSGGNTSEVAEKIADAFGNDIELKDVTDASADDLNADLLIFGTSTWGIGDIQDDFEDFIETIEDADLNGKTVALFGLGDQDSYPDTFCNGMAAIYEVVKDSGCKLIGQVATEGYDFEESESEVDGKFVGLAIDEDNQSELTEERINKWIEQLKSELA